ncbi:MAG: SRPBCC domain-containing protein [Gordonia sp. (in: high G+C Gram-positive bacteria)]
MTTEDPSATTDVPEFSITRLIDAPRELVWQAWTDAAELARRLHPFGVSTDGVAAEVRVGGRYSYTMTNDETGEKFPTGGEYLAVEPIDRLVFTWGDPDAPIDEAPVITLTLRPLGERTELVFHLRGYDGKPGDGFVYDGWDEALTNIGRHLTGETIG